jgi:allantoinase
VTVAAVRSQRVLLPSGMAPALVHVRDGRIVAIADHGDRPAGLPLLDVGDRVVMPGLVDTHVHINEPGRAEWEGFAHATRAAAAGGVTTIIDMPLNSVPATTTVAALHAKRTSAAGACYVDVGFWGGVVPGNQSEISRLADAGVFGFKSFLSPSGVDEFVHCSEQDLRTALPLLAARDLPLLAHAELPALLCDRQEAGGMMPVDRRSYATWLHSRPPASEHAAIEMLIRLAREFGARVHIVHLASADALDLLRDARRAGVAVTVETCPHYLTFAAEEIADGATPFKCAPPIRERSHRERLWTALARGDIDFIASDHSPSPPAMKHLDEGDFIAAWGGIASLQLGSAIVWTGMHARGIGIDRLPSWLSAGPARLAELVGRKGAIAPGCDADLVVFDPDAHATIDARRLYHRHPVTPYDGVTLRGRVQTTIVRGQIVYDEGTVVGRPEGRLLAPEGRT